tara:strand:- start:278 stop:751 length:474 start_codon:yes stop_codon:yes gene_type:complete
MKVWMTKNKNFVKIDKWDTWSMDTTLAHIIVPMLKQLKKDTHGAPMVAFEDRPDELIGTIPRKDKWETDEFHFQAWDWALDEMIWAFSSKLDDEGWEHQFFSGESDWIFEPGPGDSSYMVKGPNHTLEMDREGMKVYQERISNGFRLFGKYYENLWD